MAPITTRHNIFRLGTVLEGTYVVREVLSTGHLGQVFAAYDQRLGREVTIKAMWPHLEFERLRQESQALAAFRHPGLVTVHGLGKHGGIEYLVLERVAGMTLAAHLKQRSKSGGFTIVETLETLIGICDALAVIHSAGMAHGHLRPDNIMLVRGGRIVLSDFGVVHRDERAWDAVAPERARYDAPETNGISARVSDAQQRDIYALGVLAFELLTGTSPAPGVLVASQLARACTGVPETLSQLIGELLADQAWARPRGADLIAASLRSIRTVPGDQPRALSVVVADDDPDMHELLSTLIRQVAPAAAIRFATNGAEALRLVQRDPPDVLLLDLQMPKLNGLEVCMYLRGTSLGDRITICVVSSFGPTHRAVLKGLGVVDIVGKDDGPDALATVIFALFRRFAPPPALPSHDKPGTVGGRYVLERQLGAGGMGRVYEARHLQLGKRFALKVISPELAQDPVSRGRFIEEARLASEITHPNIVSVVDYGEDRELGAFMVMELLEGETLTSIGGRRLSLRRTCDVLGQIADALELIHRRGIVHGDIKTENIMLVEETTGTRRRRIARLLDFGLAHRISAGDSASETVFGTPEYFAPERALGAPATVATDIYALGVLGYHLLTGTLPFEGTHEEVMSAHVHEEVPALDARRGEPIDPAVDALIRRALAKDPAQRHASVTAFHYELNTVMEMLGLGRRRAKVSQAEVAAESFAKVFLRSSIGQALVTTGGAIVLANEMFRTLLGDDEAATKTLTSLEGRIPGVVATVTKVHAEGQPSETRTNGLVLWAAPLPAPAQEIQLLLRAVDDHNAT